MTASDCADSAVMGFDRTLESEDYNNIKFNMQKVLFQDLHSSLDRIAEIFGISVEECQALVGEFDGSIYSQAQALGACAGMPAVSRPLTVAFIGDSITSDRESYLNIIRRLYSEELNLRIIDASVSGDKSDDAVMHFYPRVLQHRPDIAHILLGTNDLRRNNDPDGKPCVTVAEFSKNLSYMVRALSRTGCRVVISTISPVNNKNLVLRFPEENWTYDLAEIDQLNEAIAQVASENGAQLNDMRPVYANYLADEVLLRDGLHLNGLGQLLLARNVVGALGVYF